MEIGQHEPSTNLRNYILPSYDSPRLTDTSEVQGLWAAPRKGVSYGEQMIRGSAKGPVLSLDLGQLSMPDPPAPGES